jgi:peptidoglycan biosynthesis protein MviN/MurJ (putative lipid II flippase)
MLSWLQGVIAVADLRHAGLSLATGLASTANALFLLVVLRRLLPGMRLSAFLRSAVLHLGAALLMAAAVSAWAAIAASWSFRGAVALRVAVGVAGGSATYLAAAAWMGSGEIRELLAAMRGRGA